METLQSAVAAKHPNYFVASVDLKEAYYSILIFREHRKYFLNFLHNGRKFQFTALVIGLSGRPRIFTKILKPVFATLRSVSAAYIHDSCLQG